MSYDKVKEAKKIKIGLKQTLKSIEQGDIDLVVIAQDADDYIIKQIVTSCEAKKMQYTYVESMRKLGKACGIDVGAATVGLKM